MKNNFLLLFISLLIYTSLSAQITAYPDTSICPTDTITLGTTLVDFCGNCYSYQELEYAPEPIAGTAITMPDDTYIGPYEIGFPFCFFGITYTQFYLCSNGWISFVEPTEDMADNWTPDGPIPDATINVPRAAIFGTWTDWNTGACEECIHFDEGGEAPNRRLIVTWDAVPLFSCEGLIGTFQMVLRETSNFIDNHFTDVYICPEWHGGLATLGLQNETGEIAFTVEDRNATSWVAHHESWRWYTSDVTWYLDGEIIGTGQTVDVSPDETTTYTVIQTMCDGIEYTDDVTISVGADFDVVLLTTDISCGGAGNGAVSIDVTGGFDPYSYEWSTGDEDVTELTGLEGGDYSVIVTEAGGCSREYDFTIEEPEDLAGAPEDIINNPCNAYSEGSVHIAATGGVEPYSYSLDGAGSISTPDFSGLAAKDYNVTITDANGCTAEVPFTITEPILFVAELSADDENILAGQTAMLTVSTNLSKIESITWDPELPCSDEPCFTMYVTPLVTTTYTVTVVDSMGCVSTDKITIYVEFIPEVYFPSAFSPNGDGTNDMFQSVAYNITSYELKIYNRWGTLVYEAHSYDAAGGWDGKFEGKEQEMGSYIWQVVAGFNTGEFFSDSGNFTLVK